MSMVKFDVDKSDELINFDLWQVQVKRCVRIIWIIQAHVKRVWFAMQFWSDYS